MSREKISACLMVKNEEAVLRDCLESLSFADEIVIVDGESTDRTREIAAEFTPRVVARPFAGHVDQRAHSLTLARHPWIFCIDADERVTPALRDEIVAVLEGWDGVTEGYSVPRLTIHLGREVRRGGWYPDRKLRLARADRVKVGGVTPHDRLEVQGKTERFEGPLLHLSYRDLSHHVEVLNRYASVMAVKRRDRGRGPSLFGLLFAGPLKFLKMYLWKLGVLEGSRGFIVAVFGAFYVFLRHAKQWESEKLRSDREPVCRGDSPFARPPDEGNPS